MNNASARIGGTTRPVTLTIKQVPERLVEGLRQRAADNRRSRQQELLLMLERAIDGSVLSGVAEPAHAVYRTDAGKSDKSARKSRSHPSGPSQRNAGKLSLDALWQRARKLGAGMPSESSAIVRVDRDADRRSDATVVDASAIAAVLFDEPEAAPIVASIAGNLIAPTLLRCELASVCTTKLIRHPQRADQIHARYRLLDQLAIDYIEPDWPGLPALARRWALSAYDAAYLQLALARGAALVTLDARLAAAWDNVAAAE